MNSKVQATHLERKAFVYVRQSSVHQMLENTESTKRQYALVDKAIALGWMREQVTVIDEDQGKSGARKEGRHGFQRLVDAVIHGDAGAIFAIEVSRLARSSQDWQRLLSLCDVADVCVIDEQTVYDPKNKDDKLLLDLKGTMSEAELHWLGLRLYGARQSKARRGELKLSPPTGYVWGPSGFEMDPDESIRESIQTMFNRFAIEPSAWSVVKWARKNQMKLPTKTSYSDGTSKVEWRNVNSSRLSEMLHSPIYAGAYVFGRRKYKRTIDEDGQIKWVRENGRNPKQWSVFKQNAHPGYITWEQYLKNTEKLRQNYARMGNRRKGAPREGLALLQGLLLCGRCGHRMGVMYQSKGSAKYRYHCQAQRAQTQQNCWSVAGESLDEAVQELFLKTMVPDELSLCLALTNEIQKQIDDLDKLWKVRREKASYEAARAERRYKAVEPENRVVARTLEREWEERLRALAEIQSQWESAREQKRAKLTESDRERIRNLSKNLPKLWHAKTTSFVDRKTMLRMVVDVICATPMDVPKRATQLKVKWQSGVVDTLWVDRPSRQTKSKTPKASFDLIVKLNQQGMRDREIMNALNEKGLTTGQGRPFTIDAVKWVRYQNKIRQVAPPLPKSVPLPDCLEAPWFSVTGAAKKLGLSKNMIHAFIRRGELEATKKDYGNRRNVYWIKLTDHTIRRLEKSP